MHWNLQQTEELLASCRDFIEHHVQSPRQLKLFQRALLGLRMELLEAKSASPPFFMVVPLSVYSAIRGEWEPARPLTVATTLLFLGVDILDDVADGDLPKHWKGFKESEVNLVGATLLSTLPQMAIAELEVSPETIVAMQKTLAEGLLKMSAGQELDLTLSRSDGLTAEWQFARGVEASVAAKSGDEVALFAALAAQLAGAPPSVVESYRAMGREIGTAGQLASDCHDLFQAKTSRDLANGTRTLPIALYLEKKKDPERRNFLELLNKAREGRPVVGEIRQSLHHSEILRLTSFLVELHCQSAKRELIKAHPLEPAASWLRSTIESTSFYSKGDA